MPKVNSLIMIPRTEDVTDNKNHDYDIMLYQSKNGSHTTSAGNSGTLRFDHDSSEGVGESCDMKKKYRSQDSIYMLNKSKTISNYQSHTHYQSKYGSRTTSAGNSEILRFDHESSDGIGEGVDLKKKYRSHDSMYLMNKSKSIVKVAQVPNKQSDYASSSADAINFAIPEKVVSLKGIFATELPQMEDTPKKSSKSVISLANLPSPSPSVLEPNIFDESKPDILNSSFNWSSQDKPIASGQDILPDVWAKSADTMELYNSPESEKIKSDQYSSNFFNEVSDGSLSADDDSTVLSPRQQKGWNCQEKGTRNQPSHKANVAQKEDSQVGFTCPPQAKVSETPVIVPSINDENSLRETVMPSATALRIEKNKLSMYPIEEHSSRPLEKETLTMVDTESLAAGYALKRSTAMNPSVENHFLRKHKRSQASQTNNLLDSDPYDQKSGTKLVLDSFVKSSPDVLKPDGVLKKIWLKTKTSFTTLTELEAEKNNLIKNVSNEKRISQSFYWEREMQNMTARRRLHSKKQRRWGKLSRHRLEKKMQQVYRVNDKRSYYSVFRHSNGRTNPWKGMIVSVLWTTIFLCFHKNYLDWGKYLNMTIDPWFSFSFFNYFSIALGFLLYMQAAASSRRWWEGRVHWQRIMENSKTLTVLLNTHLSCLRLSKYGTRLILGHTICVRNLLQNKWNPVWREELMEVLDEWTVNKIMAQPRRIRYLAVLYAFQRIIELCIETQIMPREVIRDINPTIVIISQSIGACNQIRMTKLPYVIAVHLQFMFFVFMVFLPISLVGVGEYSEWDYALTDMNYFSIYSYGLLIGYAYFGLCRMALDVDDPFSFTREHHSFGFWGFYEYWTAIELEHLRTVFRFRAAKHGEHGMSGNGNYGDRWASDKLEIPIRRLINEDLPATHNLFGRQEKVLKQLDINKRDTSYWDHFNSVDRSSDDESFTFASAPEDEEFVTSPDYVRSSVVYKRPSVHLRNLRRYSLQQTERRNSRLSLRKTERNAFSLKTS